MLTSFLHRGFTAIEMLITLTIVAILATLAAPSFKTMLATAQIRTAAQAMFDGLQLARVEAIRRNERVTFAKGIQSGWTITVESDGSTVQSRAAGEGTPDVQVTVTPAGASKVTFDGLGRLKPNTDASSSISQLDADVSTALIPAAGSRALRVTVSSAGSARLCDPNAAAGAGTGC
jgi:type IV fimbrial biogenesis protein FimT